MIFFRKKSKESKPEETAAKVEPKPDHNELVRQADDLVSQIENADGKEKCDLLERRGEALMSGGEDDAAIEAFEECIKAGRRMGVPYRSLTTLYNRKRRVAAEQGDEEEAKLYLGKLQNLMQSSKDLLRGK
jgi:tetratricopeptide (TPR) repeat protein